MSTQEASPYRLGRAVIPARYDLTLTPDLEAARFSGSEDIVVNVQEPVDAVVLNAEELEIDGGWLEDGAGTRIQITRVDLDAKTERATLNLASAAAAGTHTLHVDFHGILNDMLRGFYRSRFKDENGVEHTIATTHFESTDARRAFPCFDEPDLKAVFGVTLKVPEDLFAVSNAPIASEERPGDGTRVVKFADSMKMSTYLVAFIVGPLEATEPVDVDSVALRVVHPIGKGHLAKSALEAGAFSLRFFADYYGIPYPAEKLDLVALPDFAMGAMENLGCVTFREALLLMDPEKVTQGELSRVAEVVAHELAHMWFGDLVTMRWWNGIWLNEAFATFMANAAVDAFRPEWQRWVQFALDRSAAFDVDALASTRPIEYPVESPQDAEGMFDVLTYEKGGSVLRMLQQYLGEDRYRDGIRHYLKKHSYGNTETNDLWDALEEVTGEPVRRIMDSWIFQGGFPLVRAQLNDGGRTLTLAQRRFEFSPTGESESMRWSVPLVLRVGQSGKTQERRELLEGDRVEIPLAEPADYVLVNAGSNGFYRVAYDATLLSQLSERMYRDLEPIERFNLLDDVWTAVLAGEKSSLEFLDLARRFTPETDVEVWKALSGCLSQLSRILEGDALGRFRAEVRKLAGPALDRVGWTPQPSESERDRELRGVLIRALCILGQDPAGLAKARELHGQYLADAGAVEPNVAAAVVGAVASAGTAADYETFLGRFKAPSTPQEELRYLYSLAGFPGEAEFKRTLEMTLSGEIRTQNAPFVLGSCMGNRHHGALAWQFIRSRWDEVNHKYPSNTIARMLGGVRAFSKPEIATEILAFFKTHEVPQGRLMVQQHLETMQVHVQLREREAARLAKSLPAS